MIHSLTNIWSVEIQTARQVARSGVSISSRVGLVQDVLSLIFWFFSGNFKKLSNIWPEHGAFSFMVFQIAFVRIVAWHTALRTEKGNTFLILNIDPNNRKLFDVSSKLENLWADFAVTGTFCSCPIRCATSIWRQISLFVRNYSICSWINFRCTDVEVDCSVVVSDLMLQRWHCPSHLSASLVDQIWRSSADTLP